MLILAHLAVRWFARGADPTLLPLAAHPPRHRLRDDHPARRPPRRSADDVEHRRHRRASSLTLLVVPAGARPGPLPLELPARAASACCCCPLVPGLGFGVGGARIWVNLGPINFQPGEFAKLALAIFFAGYLAENRELIAASTWKVGPFHLPEPRHLLPILLAWGFAVLVMVGQRDLGSSLLFFALFVVMMWVATERASYLLHRPRAVRRRRPTWRGGMFAHVQTRVDIWLDPWSRPARLRLPDHPGPVRAVRRRHRRHRARPRQPRSGARGPERLHLHRDRRGARPVRRRRRC